MAEERLVVTITSVQPNYKVGTASGREPVFVRKSSMRGGPGKWAELKLGDRVEFIMKVCAGRGIVADAVLAQTSAPPSGPPSAPPLPPPSEPSSPEALT